MVSKPKAISIKIDVKLSIQSEYFNLQNIKTDFSFIRIENFHYASQAFSLHLRWTCIVKRRRLIDHALSYSLLRYSTK